MNGDYTLKRVTDPTGQAVEYEYDAAKRVTGVETTADGRTYKNAYTYEDDRIKTVSHNTTSDTATDVTYTFDYDDLGRKTTVKVGTQTLSTNVYKDDRSGLLEEVQYGNDGKVRYAHDDFDRLTGVAYDGADRRPPRAMPTNTARTARRRWYTTTACTAPCRRSTTWPSAPCSPRCGTRRATSSTAPR